MRRVAQRMIFRGNRQSAAIAHNSVRMIGCHKALRRCGWVSNRPMMEEPFLVEIDFSPLLSSGRQAVAQKVQNK